MTRHLQAVPRQRVRIFCISFVDEDGREWCLEARAGYAMPHLNLDYLELLGAQLAHPEGVREYNLAGFSALVSQADEDRAQRELEIEAATEAA